MSHETLYISLSFASDDCRKEHIDVRNLSVKNEIKLIFKYTQMNYLSLKKNELSTTRCGNERKVYLIENVLDVVLYFDVGDFQVYLSIDKTFVSSLLCHNQTR